MNIFRNNLEEERKSSSRNGIEHVLRSQHELEQATHDDDDENESLSKMEPPQF